MRTKKEYKKIIRGELVRRPTINSNGCCGKPEHSKSHNLEVKRYRMVKTKQKASDCCRSPKDGKFFTRIRGYIFYFEKWDRSVLNGGSPLIQTFGG